MNNNKLPSVIREVMRRAEKILARGEIKTHELVQLVTDDKLYPWSDDFLVATYQKQFVTQAALCELYFDYAAHGGKSLQFSPISVKINIDSKQDQQSPESKTSQISEFKDYTPNHAFYLDFTNFYSATRESVQELLNGFWQRYSAFMDKSPALKALELNEGATWTQIKAQYRRLAKQHHPDKGGERQKFIEIRQAFESLKRFY